MLQKYAFLSETPNFFLEIYVSSIGQRLSLLKEAKRQHVQIKSLAEQKVWHADFADTTTRVYKPQPGKTLQTRLRAVRGCVFFITKHERQP